MEQRDREEVLLLLANAAATCWSPATSRARPDVEELAAVINYELPTD